jgi:hypothetical protein
MALPLRPHHLAPPGPRPIHASKATHAPILDRPTLGIPSFSFSLHSSAASARGWQHMERKRGSMGKFGFAPGPPFPRPTTLCCSSRGYSYSPALHTAGCHADSGAFSQHLLALLVPPLFSESVSLCLGRRWFGGKIKRGEGATFQSIFAPHKNLLRVVRVVPLLPGRGDLGAPPPCVLLDFAEKGGLEGRIALSG